MQPAEFERFKAVMNGMSKVYEREIDGVLLDAYWLSLRSWSLRDFEQAAGHLMGNSKFMPRPADFTELRNAGRPTGGEAFAQALAHCASSSYRAGPHPDPIIDACVRACGGYLVIAMSEQDRLPFIERRFAEHFEHLQDAEDTREALPQITRRGPPQLSGPRHVSQVFADSEEWEPMPS